MPKLYAKCGFNRNTSRAVLAELQLNWEEEVLHLYMLQLAHAMLHTFSKIGEHQQKT
jgi:hypothetical protein